MATIGKWWASVPDWAKPVILGFALVTLAGFLRWGVPTMLRRIYIWALKDFDKTEKQLLLDIIRQKKAQSSNLIIDSEEVLKHCKYPRWLIEKAQQWEAERKRFG